MQYKNAKGCRKLIVQIIEQALDDIYTKRKSQSPLLDWHHAYKWIFSESFELWCDMIDFDFATIRRHVEKKVGKKK